jgi:hypothetical protein
MSASKMRAAAIDNDIESFKSGLPAGLQGDAEQVFSAVRQGLEPWLEEKVSEAGKFPFAGAKVGHKEGPAGQWSNKGPKANRPAKVGDLVGGSAS